MNTRTPRPGWWLSVDGQSYGPYDLRTMQGYIAEGRVTGASIVCKVGDSTWSPASNDPQLFRANDPARQPPPFAGAPPGAAAPQMEVYADEAPSEGLGTNRKIVLAVLGAALAGLFFVPWVNVMMYQASGWDIVQLSQSLRQLGSVPGGIPGGPPGQPGLQVNLGWRAYAPLALYLIPLAGLATVATALAGRLWRVAAIACGVVVWGIVAVAAVNAADSGVGWSQVQDSLRYLTYGAYGTLVVATVITAIGFTRA